MSEEIDFRFLIEQAQEVFSVIEKRDDDWIYRYINPFGTRLLDSDADEVIGRSIREFFPDEAVRMCSLLRECIDVHTPLAGTDTLTIRKKEYHFEYRLTPMPDGRSVLYCARDVTETVNAKTTLKETNIALRVLLTRKDEEKSRIRAQISRQISTAIQPFLNKIRYWADDYQIENVLDVIQTNLDLLADYSGRSDRLIDNGLSPRELEVAKLIQKGHTGKEIAGLLNVSEASVAYYRGNIRRKLDITHEKISLYDYLIERMK